MAGKGEQKRTYQQSRDTYIRQRERDRRMKKVRGKTARDNKELGLDTPNGISFASFCNAKPRGMHGASTVKAR